MKQAATPSPEADFPMIQLEGISKRFLMGEVAVRALEDISITIQRGEFVSIMGPSGSGKSTLMQILGALDTPTEGIYALEGYDITRLKDRELAKIRNQHFGFVFQAYNLFPELSALENVELPLSYAGVKPRECRERAAAYLETVGLGSRLRHYPAQLSGGQQQRVAIARALVTDPTVVLADEPTGNLSRDGGDEILAIFEQLHREGVAIVMVTHDPRVGALAHRQIILEDGRVFRDEDVIERTFLDFHAA